MISHRDMRGALARDYARTLQILAKRRPLTSAELDMLQLLDDDTPEQAKADAHLAAAYDLADTLNRFGRYAIEN